MMPFAASLLVKVTVILLLALAGVRLARTTRASVRHVLLASAFVALMAVPIASIVAPSIQVALPVAISPRAAPFEMDRTADTELPAAPADSARSTAESSQRTLWPSWSVLLGGVWAVGTVLFLLPVLAGLWQVRSLRRSGAPWRHGRSVADPLALEATIRRPVDVLVHESIPGPMTCGVVRPAIVLPVEAQRWSDEDLRRAIVHELEHVRRRDWVSQCVARVACACYWFHPLVWIACRELSLEAERACDDAVLQRFEPTAYADQLVVLAERLSAVASAPILAMANRRDLAARVRAVLDNGQPRGRAGARWLTLGAAAAALVVTAMSPVRVVAIHTPPVAQPAASPKFDVVSIKRCAPQVPPPVAGGRGRGGGGGNVTASRGSLHVDCSTLEIIIDKAYNFFGEPLLNESGPAHEDTPRVKGGPDWLRSEKYEIEAKADPSADRKVLMGPMMRAFLEDRLQLKLHRDVEEMPAYALTVAKGGLKIKPIGEGGCTPFDPEKAQSPNPAPMFPRTGPPMCGSIQRSQSESIRVIDLGGMELEILMTVLKLDRRVVDRTGMPDTARFNIHLELPADETQTDPGEQTNPNVFRALEQQLGLKLEPIKAPHGFLVIDHIERPSPNSGPRLVSPAVR